VTPTREIFFNIDGVAVLYVLFAMSIATFAWGIAKHVRRWRLGRPANLGGSPWRRIVGLFRDGLLMMRSLRRYRRSGVQHLILLWAGLMLVAGTTVCFVHEDLGIPIMQGDFYLYFQSLSLDIAGALLIAALLGQLAQRYLLPPARFKSSTSRDALPIVAVLTIAITGFLMEGARIQLTADPWAAWSPVGNGIGYVLTGVFGEGSLAHFHRTVWWLHAVLVFGVIAWLPHSKLLHAMTAPANILLRREGPKGALAPMRLQDPAEVSVAGIEQFTWKDLLDLDACTECGRCDDSCPATRAGKPLEPRRLILSLRSLMAQADGPGGASAASVIPPQTLWACTTCRACTDVCPVNIEHVDKIVQMRRQQVLGESQFPAEYQKVFRNLEVFGDALGKGPLLREEWLNGAPNVRRVGADDDGGEPVELLFWAGCMGSLYDERSRTTLRTAVRVLEKAGVKVSVLGREERCCGDPARRMGNEYLFETLARKNVETFASRGVRKVVTQCPHCFNTLKNEYGQFGANLDVVHLNELVAELIQSGRLEVRAQLDETFTYHDPCYLGRHNGVFDAPRVIAAAALRHPVREMERSRANSACCGAGGGAMWAGPSVGKRLEENRIEEALETSAAGVATSCPFCTVMLDSAARQKGVEHSFQVTDVIELIDRAT
jgi:Fe-S oxidoreductase/nitrate reductase gamma subunit